MHTFILKVNSKKKVNSVYLIWCISKHISYTHKKKKKQRKDGAV